MYKKLISIVLSSALLIGAAYIPAAAKDEKVTLIVETEGAPLLATKNAVRMGAADYMETGEAKDTEAHILRAQSAVKSNIERRTNADVNSGFTYTSVFNGFSIDARESDIEKIKAVDGVKNVYISKTYDIPREPVSNGESEPGYGAAMINAQAMYDAGYDGRGQAVAIIDGAFDTSHDFFASDIENPKFTKSSIKELIENNKLNANISANQVYKSEKIPFAYDYGEGDADTYAADIHGTHVAGIAAGKNGVIEDTTFSGVAPEAQLVLMKVADSDDIMNNSTIIAAMDDASKMGVCAVNASLGGSDGEDPPYITASNNLRRAGIAFVCAAGNDNRYEETTDNPDYSYNIFPAGLSSATAVASIEPNRVWVFSGKFTLGDEKLDASYSKPFFEKFSDKPYEYVCGETLADFQAMDDIAGKIAVAPYGTDAKSSKLLEMGVVGLIAVSKNEDFFVISTVSDEIPGVMVSKSVGEKLRNAENKAIQANVGEIIYNKDNEPVMADYTNWGTGASLELKPEITAPGSNILSSVNDDEYRNDSGTSMAAPQITGAMALMSGFVDAKYPAVNEDKVALMENLLMSSADIVFQDEGKTLPESPRRQGAGLVDLKNAMKIPVILKGDTGKSKLSLKDNLTDDITLKFTAKNLTGEPVTYDNIKIYAFTDNYEERDGKNIITDSVKLEFEPDAENPSSVTVPANGEKEITLKIKLNSARTTANKEIFTNGFWVDGFVVLSSSNGAAARVSMPYTGFYGDWTAIDAIATPYFGDGGGDGGLMMSYGDADFMLGTNLFAQDEADRSEYESEDYVGLSDAHADDYYVLMCMRRTLTDANVKIEGVDGDLIGENKIDFGLTRKTEEEGGGNATLWLYFDDVSDGDYYVTVSGKNGYGSNQSRVEERTYKCYIDSEPPDIQNPEIYEEGGREYASFTASDNRYLMGAAAHDASGKTVTEPIKAEKSADIKLDITGMDADTLEFSVIDYAYNENVFTIGKVSAEITGVVTNGGSAAVFANVTNTADDADADVITAVYDYDGRLIGIDKQNVILKSGEKKVFTFGFDDVPDADAIKLFVWKHGEMTPLCAAVTK